MFNTDTRMIHPSNLLPGDVIVSMFDNDPMFTVRNTPGRVNRMGQIPVGVKVHESGAMTQRYFDANRNVLIVRPGV